jgi:hypothetical protein
VRIIKQDEFELDHVDDIYDKIKVLFADNEEYFHILPQLFMQYFYKSVFVKKRPVLEVEKELMTLAKRLSAKTAESLKGEEP